MRNILQTLALYCMIFASSAIPEILPAPKNLEGKLEQAFKNFEKINYPIQRTKSNKKDVGVYALSVYAEDKEVKAMVFKLEDALKEQRTFLQYQIGETIVIMYPSQTNFGVRVYSKGSEGNPVINSNISQKALYLGEKIIDEIVDTQTNENKIIFVPIKMSNYPLAKESIIEKVSRDLRLTEAKILNP